MPEFLCKMHLFAAFYIHRRVFLANIIVDL